MKLRQLSVVCGLLFIAGALTSMFDFQKEKDASPLTIALPSVNLEIDPHVMEDIQSMFLAQQIHRSLFRYSSDGTIFPDLADSVSFSPDRRQMQIRIKKNQTFADGSPLTADHVARSLRRPFVIGAGVAADLSYIVGAEEALRKKDESPLAIEVHDPLTVSIQMTVPSDLLPTHLGLPDLSILKLAEDGHWDQAATSGEFTIETKDDHSIALKSRSSGKMIRLLKLNPEDAFAKALSGEIDSIEQYALAPNQIRKLEDIGWHTAVHSLSYENFLLMDSRRLSPEVRTLAATSLKSVDLVKALGHGLQPAYGLIPPNLPGALSVPYVPNRAQGTVGREKFALHYNRNNQLHERTALYIQSLLALSGIEVTPSPLDHDDFYDHLLNKKSAAIIAGKGLDYPDGLANLTYFRTDIQNHFLFMENSSLDRELGQLTALPADDREAVYQGIQKRILDQATVVPLYFGNNTSGLWSPRVKTVPNHPFGFQFLKLSEVK